MTPRVGKMESFPTISKEVWTHDQIIFFFKNIDDTYDFENKLIVTRISFDYVAGDILPTWFFYLNYIFEIYKMNSLDHIFETGQVSHHQHNIVREQHLCPKGGI